MTLQFVEDVMGDEYHKKLDLAVQAAIPYEPLCSDERFKTAYSIVLLMEILEGCTELKLDPKFFVGFHGIKELRQDGEVCKLLKESWMMGAYKQVRLLSAFTFFMYSAEILIESRNLAAGTGRARLQGPTGAEQHLKYAPTLIILLAAHLPYH